MHQEEEDEGMSQMLMRSGSSFTLNMRFRLHHAHTSLTFFPSFLIHNFLFCIAVAVVVTVVYLKLVK